MILLILCGYCEYSNGYKTIIYLLILGSDKMELIPHENNRVERMR
jgi:hypothetical protein